MSTRCPFRHAVLAATGGVLVLTILAGCASSPRRRGFARRESDHAAPPVPEMRATGEFFAHRLAVEVLLNRAGFPRGERTGRDDSGDGAGGHRGGHGGFGGGFGHRGERGAEGGGRWRGQEESGETGSPRPHIVASNQPPVALHLRVTNHGNTPLQVAVTDFESDLGNFVVQPAILSVPANGSAEADPMTSRLGVTRLDIPLTVTLSADGRTETEILHLKPKPTAAATASGSGP